jgi:hypothetical protein
MPAAPPPYAYPGVNANARYPYIAGQDGGNGGFPKQFIRVCKLTCCIIPSYVLEFVSTLK